MTETQVEHQRKEEAPTASSSSSAVVATDGETNTSSHHSRSISVMNEFTMLELDHDTTKQGMQVATIKESHPTPENAEIPTQHLVIVTETANLTSEDGYYSGGSGGETGSGDKTPVHRVVASLTELDFDFLAEGKFKVRDWKGDKFYSDYIREGLQYKKQLTPDLNVVMLFESPSSSTSESSFHNAGQFKFHDWPPPTSIKSKAVLGPCRYALMNGQSYSSFLRDGVPPVGLLEHWQEAVPNFVPPTFVPQIHADTDTVYAYLPVEQLPKHVNDPHVHYHLAGKDAIHLMTQKTTKLLEDTRTSRPCVVKTTHSMGSKGIFIIQTDEDEAEFQEFLRVSGNPTFVITDFVDIHRNVACHFFMHPDGSVVWFGSNENHRDPETGKFSSDSYLLMKDQKQLKQMQLPFVEEVVTYCLGLGFWGFCGIDVLFDSQGNGYLVDINPRVTGSCPALMTLKQLEKKYGFTVGLFRRSGDIVFYGKALELLELVRAYNVENEGKSRIVVHSYFEPEDKDFTKINIGVYGTDLDLCKTVLNTYAKPPPPI